MDDDGIIHVFITSKPCRVVAGVAENFPVFVAQLGGLLADGAGFQLLFGKFAVCWEGVVAVLTDCLEKGIDLFRIGVVGERRWGDQDR